MALPLSLRLRLRGAPAPPAEGPAQARGGAQPPSLPTRGSRRRRVPRGRRTAGAWLGRGAETGPPPALRRSSPLKWRSAWRRGGHGDPEHAPHPPRLLRPPLRPVPPLMARTSAGHRQPCSRSRRRRPRVLIAEHPCRTRSSEPPRPLQPGARSC